jgi:hypothetical protein
MSAPKKSTASSLRLFIDLNRYGTGEFEDSQNAIARPWRRLFQDGTDPGEIYYLTVRPSGAESSRALGSLCKTSGGRVLFFPGCRGRDLNNRFTRENITPAVLTGIVGHLTFDIADRKAHITEVAENGDRRVALNLSSRREVDSGLYAWFGLTLRKLEALESVPRRLWFTAECPSSDVERRRKLFREAGQASRISNLEISPLAPDTFMQINFFVDLQPAQTRPTMRSFLPKGPPELRKEVTVPQTMAATLQSLELDRGAVMVRIHPIAWEGDPVADVGFGF